MSGGTTAPVKLGSLLPKRARLDAAAPGAEDLAREVTLMGGYDHAEDAISSWFAAGADSVHLVLPPGRPEDELAEIVDVAAAVREPVLSP